MKTILVTGAEGFAGRHLVQHLTKCGYDVVGAVRNRARKLAYERAGQRALVCEVADAINVARVIASVKPDGIVHLAGTAVAHLANAEPLAAYQSIVSGWANVLDGVRRSAPRARVLLVSACDVYGNAGDHGEPITEDTPVAAVSTFGALKATAETIADTFFRNYHLNLTIARPFHHTGTGQSEAFFYGAVARRLLDWDPSVQGSTMQLPDLDCRRDVLHVDDVVDAYTRLLENGAPNAAYNVSSGRHWTVRELVQMIAGNTGTQVDFQPLAADSDGQIRVLCGDNSKLRELTGWQPTRTPEQAMQDLVAGVKAEAGSGTPTP